MWKMYVKVQIIDESHKIRKPISISYRQSATDDSTYNFAATIQLSLLTFDHHPSFPSAVPTIFTASSGTDSRTRQCHRCHTWLQLTLAFLLGGGQLDRWWGRLTSLSVSSIWIFSHPHSVMELRWRVADCPMSMVVKHLLFADDLGFLWK